MEGQGSIRVSRPSMQDKRQHPSIASADGEDEKTHLP
jgi:hypothetical protein